MPTVDHLVVPEPDRLPPSLRQPISGVSFASYVCVEAARLDDLPDSAVLAWLQIRPSVFLRVEEQWSDLLSEELCREGSGMDTLHEELLGRALSLWRRDIDPLDRDVDAFLTFQRHASMTPDLGRSLGLTAGDEIRLARLHRIRLSDPAAAAAAVLAWSGPPGPIPALKIAPFVFPPALEGP